MPLKQLPEIFIEFNVFDCFGAIFTDWKTLGPFWVRKLNFFLENLPVLWSNWFRALVWTSQKVELEMRHVTRIIAVDEFFMLNLSFEISHFTGKKTQNLSALQGLFPSSDWFDLEFRRKISKSYIMNMPRNFQWNDYFLSIFFSRDMPLDG